MYARNSESNKDMNPRNTSVICPRRLNKYKNKDRNFSQKIKMIKKKKRFHSYSNSLFAICLRCQEIEKI
jgi:hypothetical protein